MPNQESCVFLLELDCSKKETSDPKEIDVLVSYPSLNSLVFTLGNNCHLLEFILRLHVRVKEMFY